ncbi:hypothetical protein Q7Q91_09465 [Lactiplantibacillus pentosus]|uniref:hypothetical protein n=1 Tax=Lactiplantibacillus pentosus TaxID=1589 RepID=UPI0026F8BF1A|nr:hypothetical protein [Lactiplantibacillus pentosus]MDO7805207.1 hypothetical protein [Lactiplantibacillus pentosus]
MNVTYTDGYWVIDGYIDTEHEDAQAIMKKAKEQFINANPLIDASKVVVVNGQFKQPMLADLRTGECKSLTHDMIAFRANGEPHYKPRD